MPGHIEVVEAGDPLAFGGNEGKIKVWAWQGPDAIINPIWDEAKSVGSSQSNGGLPKAEFRDTAVCRVCEWSQHLSRAALRCDRD